MCRVRLSGAMLTLYPVENRVKQGSVPSLALFFLVMNPLLVRLQQSGLGLSVNKFYAGVFSMLTTFVTNIELTQKADLDG